MKKHSISTENQLAMTSNEILKADVLDIVFDNRNKNYGAYVLRKYYNNRLVIAMSGMLAVVVVLILIVLLNPEARRAVASVIDPDVVTVQTLPDPPVEEPQLPQPQRQNVHTEHYVNQIEIVPDTEEASMPEQDALTTAAFGDHQEDGPDLTAGQQPPQNNNAVAAPEVTTPEPTPAPAPSSAAAFPGGQEKWADFLSRNLRTPGDLEAGQKRSVLVRFSVSEDGSVTQFEIVQSGGEAFDREVLRVLRKMPRWKPAIQNGRPVSVLFTQPVTFVAMEE